MINKEKITRVDIYDANDVRVISTNSVEFPRDFFKIKGYELVVLHGNDLYLFKMDERITAIFQYTNGTRIKCDTKVDISTPQQLNFHVDDGIVLEERRRSFKVKTMEPAFISAIKRNEESIALESPCGVTILNINLGGVLMKCDMELFPEDIITMKVLAEAMELQAEVLRKQLDNDGGLVGYGCRFLNVTPPQEEKLARHIFECQLAERERLKKEGR